MKIIDCFLMSEQFEGDLLEIKLNLEHEAVDKFVIIEGEYTFRGEYKGSNIANLLREERFRSFLDKIHLISIKENLFHGEPGELEYFEVEHVSRAACLTYIKSFSYDTWVILSDVDESLDFSDVARKNYILNTLAENTGGVQFKNLRYWYDFDNLNFMTDKRIPIYSLSHLIKNTNIFRGRNNDCVLYNPPNPVGFEYTYCFAVENNWRKLNTFSHDKYEKQSLENGLKYNHWHRCPSRGESVGQSEWDWFETVILNESNSPKFVRDNLDRLKVNTVNPRYAEDRIRVGLPRNPIEFLGLFTTGYKVYEV